MYERLAVWLMNPAGVRMQFIDFFETLQVTKVVNDTGTFMLTFDIKVPGLPKDIPNDYLIDVWRLPQGGKKWRRLGIFVKRSKRFDLTELGRQKITYRGRGILQDLAIREIDAYVGQPGSDKEGPADDIIKQYVRENLGPSASTARRINLYSVAGNKSQCPVVTRSAGRQNLLRTLQSIADESYQKGVPLYFDFVPIGTNPMRFMFFTFVNELGLDRTETMIFSPSLGNVRDASFEYDDNNEVTFAYVKGRGEGLKAKIIGVTTPSRVNLSIRSRRENTFTSNNDTTPALASYGYQKLYENGARPSFDARLLDTYNSRYGEHWEFGDRVGLNIFELSVPVLVRSIQVYWSGDDSRETISTNIEAILQFPIVTDDDPGNAIEPPSSTATKGFFSGGLNGTMNNGTMKITFATWVNTMTSMTLSVARDLLGGLSDKVSVGYFCGGKSTGYVATADRLFFVSETMAANVGSNLSVARYGVSGVSDGLTYGYFGGGFGAIHYATTDRTVFASGATAVSAVSAMTHAAQGYATLSDGDTYGYFYGGFSSSGYLSDTDRISFNSGVTAAFPAGNLVGGMAFLCGVSDSNKYGYVFAGDVASVPSGQSYRVELVTGITRSIASTLTPVRTQCAGVSDGANYGFISGGSTGPFTSISGSVDIIDFATGAMKRGHNMSYVTQGPAGASNGAV